MSPSLTPVMIHPGGQEAETRKADKAGRFVWQGNKYSVPMAYQRCRVGVREAAGVCDQALRSVTGSTLWGFDACKSSQAQPVPGWKWFLKKGVLMGGQMSSETERLQQLAKQTLTLPPGEREAFIRNQGAFVTI